MPFRYVLLAVLMCTGAAAQPELEREWEKVLGNPGLTPWLTAVCSNGVFFAIDGRNRAVAVSAKGEVLADSKGEPALFRARALACDSDGLLYAARDTNLAVLRVSKDGFEVVREAHPEVSITAMTIGPHGRVFAAGRRPGSRLPLHVLEPDGRVLFSFGEIPRGYVYPSFTLKRFLLWQKRPERLLAVAPESYEIYAYAPDGVLLDVVRPRRPRYIHPAQFATGGGEITGAALLAHGRLAVQLRSYGPFRQPDTFLELLDKEFRIVAGGIPALHGALAGASSSGGLYFFGRDATITKATLKGGAAATPVLAWNHEVFRVVFRCPVRNHRAGFGKIPG